MDVNSQDTLRFWLKFPKLAVARFPEGLIRLPGLKALTFKQSGSCYLPMLAHEAKHFWGKIVISQERHPVGQS